MGEITDNQLMKELPSMKVHLTEDKQRVLWANIVGTDITQPKRRTGNLTRNLKVLFAALPAAAIAIAAIAIVVHNPQKQGHTTATQSSSYNYSATLGFQPLMPTGGISLPQGTQIEQYMRLNAPNTGDTHMFIAHAKLDGHSLTITEKAATAQSMLKSGPIQWKPETVNGVKVHRATVGSATQVGAVHDGVLVIASTEDHAVSWRQLANILTQPTAPFKGRPTQTYTQTFGENAIRSSLSGRPVSVPVFIPNGVSVDPASTYIIQQTSVNQGKSPTDTFQVTYRNSGNKAQMITLRGTTAQQVSSSGIPGWEFVTNQPNRPAEHAGPVIVSILSSSPNRSDVTWTNGTMHYELSGSLNLTDATQMIASMYGPPQ